MKKFIGYFIIGAVSKEDARSEKGLLLWSAKRPNALVRFFNRVLLNVHWVDRVKVLEEKGYKPSKDGETQMYKVVPQKFNKYDQPRNNPNRSIKKHRGEA
jgi:hypothetical protein